MFFSGVIGEVGLGGFPTDSELPTLAAVTHPVDPHVGALEVLGLHSFVDYAAGSGVVGFYWRGALRVAHVFESLAEDGGLPCVQIDGTDLGLGSRGVDMLDHFGKDVDGRIE